jgi:D-alanyl-D-alanine carboxypeptidase/D-alanyl-D-alanine-endopeptidase (penicillin-binding protein 4)
VLAALATAIAVAGAAVATTRGIRPAPQLHQVAVAPAPRFVVPVLPTLTTVRPTTTVLAPVPVRAAALKLAPVTTPPVPATVPLPPTLAAALDGLLVNTNSCLEVLNAQGQLLYEHQPQVALAPASTQKLLVAAAALDVLGPDHRFVTSVVATQRPVNGIVPQLWLVGGGDPVLSSPSYTGWLIQNRLTGGFAVTTQLTTLAAQLAAAGVRSVPGGIHGDGNRYAGPAILPTWSPIDVQEGDVAPLSGLEVDDSLDRWGPDVEDPDPPAHAAGVLAQLLQSDGVAATQGVDAVAPAGGVVLAAVQSPPLSDIVTAMLRESNNTTAEMLTKELDIAAGGTGTTAGGDAVIEREAAHLGLPTAGLSLVDGSGLSPENRVSCATLLGALQLSSRPGLSSLGMLSVAGEFGTLYNRFLGTPAVGHLEAKTGNIVGVIGIVGRMDEHQPVSFAFLINGPFAYFQGAAYEDRLVAILGGVTS